MQVHSGARLGPYEVVSAIGAGGMGEVWRARDTRLDRLVAIKILPAEFAQDAQLRVRFDREARAISSLNHPHICTLHDVGHDNGLHFLVMELIDGESLADKLSRGPLSPEQTLRYGAQIATALDAAHRQGVIHRDLKPGNIMITKSGAKLLDFGLAKAREPVGDTSNSHLATQQKPITEQGKVLGTFQYMSPEQLEGLEVDARTDIFALGAVLYEMATGRRAFQAATKTSLITAIMTSQPEPISSIAPLSPPALEHVVRKCLEKDRDERWQSAHDVASELRWISEAGSGSAIAARSTGIRRPHRALLTALAVSGWIAAIAAGAWMMRDRAATAPTRRVFRSDLMFPPDHPATFVGSHGTIAVSPEGRRLVFPTRQSGLVVHDFETGRSTTLEGTREAMFPFWSPDGEWLGFFADGKLKRVEVTGGGVQTLCAARDGRGASWNRNGVIIFAPDIAGPLMRVSEAGGTPVPVTKVSSPVWTHRNPHFLPDGDRFLFNVRNSDTEAVASIAVGSLANGQFKAITTGSNAHYGGGRIFFVRDRNLLAQKFDPDAATLSGSPVPVAQRVEYFNPKDLGNFAVSPAGVIAFRQRTLAQSQLTWIDRTGRPLSTVGDPGLYVLARASASHRIATLIRRDENDQDSVWVMDLQRGTVTRSTENFATGMTRAIPSPFDKQIAVSTWSNAQTAQGGLWLQTPSAAGPQQALFRSANFILDDWSRDGKIIVGNIQEAGKGFDIAWVSIDEPDKLRAFASTPFNERLPRLSPDGKWIAYMSEESGTQETYISDFPGRKSRWQVTRTRGVPALWSPDGRELFVTAGSQLVAYPIEVRDDDLQIGSPKTIGTVFGEVPLAAVERDRLLILKRIAESPEEPLRIIKNWQAMLK